MFGLRFLNKGHESLDYIISLLHTLPTIRIVSYSLCPIIEYILKILGQLKGILE